MFVTSNDYEKALRSVLAEEGELFVAVAFWGRGAEEIILSGPSRTIRIICNLRSGATNPNTIANLREKGGVEVKQHDQLHAKVILGTTTALIGSANLSSNGLNLEVEEIKGWEEAGVLTRDPGQVTDTKTWLDALWKHSHPISDEDIEEARRIWEQRRSTRIVPRQKKVDIGFSIQELDRSDLQDRGVYLAISKNYVSEEAKDVYRKKQRQIVGPDAIFGDKNPPIYESWPELPKKPLIDIHYGRLGGLQCHGLFTPIKETKFRYSDGSSGHIWECAKERLLLDRRFEAQDHAFFAKCIKPHIADIWSSGKAQGNEDAKYILLADALEICGPLSFTA